jgi:hypothetical protein
MDRERALLALKRLVGTNVHSDTRLRDGVLSILSRKDDNENDANKWESEHGALLAGCALLSGANETFKLAVLDAVMDRLEHREVRVREACCVAFESLACELGASLFARIRITLFAAIASNFERDDRDQEQDRQKQKIANVSSSSSSSTSTSVLGKHDTEGWKALETAFKSLDAIMKGASSVEMLSMVDSDMLDWIDRSLVHTNRFLREAGYMSYATICSMVAKVQRDDASAGRRMAELERIGARLASGLALGLADNWSQVRFAASVAVRTFFELMSNDVDEERAMRHRYYASLLPRMCLNRYYLAQGVRLYSQTTWRQTVGEEGRELLVRYMDNVVAYYAEAAKADNHAVREAACQCIAELATRLGDKEAVRPHVRALLAPLIDCFKDMSWPVRDAACTACAHFVAEFPDETAAAPSAADDDDSSTSAASVLDDLYRMWLAHLSDNIQSVRENAAVALAHVLPALGGADALERHVMPTLRAELGSVFEQRADSQLNAQLGNVTQFGVAKPHEHGQGNGDGGDDDDARHTDQQMYSCGSLAPKLKRGAGCMDHGFARPKEPWESTDGCMFLLRELSANFASHIESLLGELARIAGVRSFAHYYYMHQTLWNAVAVIAKRINLDATLASDLLREARGLVADASVHPLCKHAAQVAIDQLMSF